jgi:NADP-dependent 3-hydroxy acid dehydrogenase YdfG
MILVAGGAAEGSLWPRLAGSLNDDTLEHGGALIRPSPLFLRFDVFGAPALGAWHRERATSWHHTALSWALVHDKLALLNRACASSQAPNALALRHLPWLHGGGIAREAGGRDMRDLDGTVAWITGAGSGIGEAAALALAKAGSRVVVTGRRKEPLEAVAGAIAKAGGHCEVAAGDLTKPADVARIAADIDRRHGRLDILVANAGVNINERSWRQLGPDGIDALVDGNLKCAFYCATAVLPIMRRHKDGLIINVASMAGRVVGVMSGPAYVAAKHGMVAMSHSINMEECVNGIRASAICPGEVATPILDRRPVPPSKDERAQMVQPADVADLIVYIARLPASVVLNEAHITPTHNRGYIAALKAPHVKV